MNNESRHVYVVLGFLRSGTSVLTRALKVFGISLGDKFIYHSDTCRWNKTGFWEDEEIGKLNAKIFESLGVKQRTIQLIDPAAQKSDELNHLKKEAIHILEKRFEYSNQFAFKDPQISKILVFWQTIFSDLALKDHYIISLRNPIAAATSLSKLTFLDLEVSLLLWLTYMISAVDYTYDKNTVVVSFESMLKEPIHTLERIQHQLNVRAKDITEENNFVNHYIDQKLFHYSLDKSDLTNPTLQVVPLCERIYHLLLKVAQDKMTFDERFKIEWQAIKKDFQNIYLIYSYIDTLLKRNISLKNALENIHRSPLWRILRPLRFLEDSIRSRRKAKRKQRRVQAAYE